MVEFGKILPDVEEPIVLDVGGSPEIWSLTSERPVRVHLLNKKLATTLTGEPFVQLLGDARRLPFGTNSYSTCFSNSVIEHVGAWEDQEAFASEIRRVSNRIWVQTPARNCPFEPHYLTLFLHWLPRPAQRRCLRHLSLWGILTKPDQATIDQMVNEVRLLSRKEMTILFPDCEIRTEKLLWVIPKSYIAVR